MRRHSTLAILMKTEATYGTDPAPAPINAIIGSNVSFTPIEGEEVQRDLLLPYMGNQGSILTAKYGRLEYDIEIAGSGTAGVAPKYSAALRSAGLAETIDAGISTAYSIVEDGAESAAMYFVSDKVQHIFLGGRANLSLNFTPRNIPKFRLSYMGLLGTISDLVSMPAGITLEGWMEPVPVSKANTQMSLHGWPSVAESLSIDLGNTLTPRFLIGDERIMISNRKSTGTAVVEARALAVVNWFDLAEASTRGPLTLTHGTVAGNIVEITAPAVQIGKPAQGQTDNIVNYSLPLALCPLNGRDELLIIIR